jgi:hypothetical protein
MFDRPFAAEAALPVLLRRSSAPAAGCAIIAFATQSRWRQSDGRT